MEQEVLLKIGVDSADVPKAINATKALEKQIELLARALDEQRITQRQSSDGLSKIVSQYRGMGVNALEAQNRVNALNLAVRENIAAAKQAAAIKPFEKALAQDAQMAADAAEHYNRALLGVAQSAKSARESAAAMSELFKEQARVEQALSQQAKAFGDAVREANTYATANKSAADSAEIFARELQKAEQIMRDQSRAFGEAVVAANTYATANKSAADSASVFEAELRKQEAQIAKTARASQEQLRALREANLANKSAADSAEVFTQQIARQEREVEQLAMKYKPLYAASKQYESAISELDRAHEIGVLSTQQHENAVERLRIEYEQFVTGTAGWENQFVQGGDRGARSVNRFGMYAQQVGYQVGDFFVQIQSGTNAFVAFGQQATQLAGLLPGLAGAIVGIGISVATTFLAAWSRASAAIDNTAKSMEHFQNKLSSARDEIIDMAFEVDLLKRGFDDASEYVLTVDIENAQKRIAEIQQQIYELELMGAPTGPNQRSLEIELERLNAAREALDEYIRLREEQERLLEAQKNGFELVVKIKTELEAAARTNLAKVFTDATGPAQTVLRTLNSFVENARIAAARIEYERKVGGGRGLGPQGPTNEELVRNVPEVQLAYGRLALTTPDTKGGTTTSGATSTALDAVQQLERQIARTRELMRLSADQAALQEEIWRITDALGDESGRYSDQRIADIARENLALQEQQRIMEEAYERQQSLYDQMSSSMENAFMSIVEGTSSAKDAFRTMAYEVIKELYRVLVVQQLVGSFTPGVGGARGTGSGIVGFLGKLFTGGFAQGGAFMGGNVTAFANGGVVGSPTMFPMSGGRTGLMGEAGPEAIMPLKRTSSGKLGVVAEGGGAVNITQNFNISANGDESVKRIVMEQAPAIAKMTQSAIIDARRRGGQMKAAFG